MARSGSRPAAAATAAATAFTLIAAHAHAAPGGAIDDPVELAALVSTHYRVVPNQVYETAADWNGKLDLYVPRRPSGAVPVAVLFHGGGWVTGSKDEIGLDVLPYLAMGFAAVNVDYRLAKTAPAPAAVEDSRCAVRWVVRHAQQYGFDIGRMVLVGSSAGGHLALMAAMAPPTAGLDEQCPGDESLRPAAVVNFFGVADAAELLEGKNPRDFALGWFGSGDPAKLELARRLSPLTYVGRDAPPVITVHGDADPVVPFEQAKRLHAALDKAGVPNRLYPVRGAGHGQFDGEQVLAVTRAVRAFLIERKIIGPRPAVP
jgi:acetyl esterase/lipase